MQHLGALGFRGVKTLELFGLGLGQQSRLGGESEEIVVAGQQFFGAGLAKTVVEGVDQVDGDMAGNEFEWLWNRLVRACHISLTFNINFTGYMFLWYNHS